MTSDLDKQGPELTDRQRRAFRRRTLLLFIGPIGFVLLDLGILLWAFGGPDAHAIGVAATGYGGGAMLSLAAIYLYDHFRGR